MASEEKKSKSKNALEHKLADVGSNKELDSVVLVMVMVVLVVVGAVSPAHSPKQIYIKKVLSDTTSSLVVFDFGKGTSIYIDSLIFIWVRTK